MSEEEERHQVVYKFENGLQEGLGENTGCTNEEKKKKSKLCYGLVILILLVAIATITTGIVLIKPSSKKPKVNTNSLASINEITKCADPSDRIIRDLNQYCEPSEEAERIGLNKFLQKCQDFYFNTFKYEELKHHAHSPQEVKNFIAKRYRPFLPTPEKLREFADKISNLQQEAEYFDADENKMKPKEVQILSEIKLLLNQQMSNSFDEDFYSGGWMLGPNYFCFHRICKLPIEINTLTFYFRPNSLKDIEFLMKTFLSYNRTIEQHITNLKLGIKSGMVRSKSACEAGAKAFREMYKNIIRHGDVSGITKSWFTSNLRSSKFYQNLTDDITMRWRKKYNKKSIIQSLFAALIHGVSKPILRYYNFLVNEYSRHCPPDHVTSGLASLPLNYQYIDGNPDFKKPTTGRLPLENTILYGKTLYKNLLPKFATFDVDIDQIYKEGLRQLKLFYPKIVEIAQQYTKLENETEAIQELRRRISAKEQWHGALKFPEAESNETAYARCADDEGAKRYCPVRWRSMEKWKNYFNRVLSMINPLLNDYFYYTGPKQTVPNCPITIKVIYSPLIETVSYLASDAKCTYPTLLGLPFFLDRYGPKFQEWSTIGHEARPGNNFQLQGSVELFANPCIDSLQSFFHHKGVFPGFSEGWALYAENPVLSNDVNLYENNILQKLGMYKWQITRAAGLVIDIGLHYKDKNKDWALGILKKYALEDLDVASKEITRHMSVPAQATTYMVGRLKIMKERKKMEEHLGENFHLKEFHYQVLSLGQVPLNYLSKHMDRYIKCLDNPSEKFCEYLLTPVNTIPNRLIKKENETPSSSQKNTKALL